MAESHQEDDVGVLIESSGHADPLPLAPAQVNPLKQHSCERHDPDTSLQNA